MVGSAYGWLAENKRKIIEEKKKKQDHRSKPLPGDLGFGLGWSWLVLFLVGLGWSWLVLVSLGLYGLYAIWSYFKLFWAILNYLELFENILKLFRALSCYVEFRAI